MLLWCLLSKCFHTMVFDHCHTMPLHNMVLIVRILCAVMMVRTFRSSSPSLARMFGLHTTRLRNTRSNRRCCRMARSLPPARGQKRTSVASSQRSTMCHMVRIQMAILWMRRLSIGISSRYSVSKSALVVTNTMMTQKTRSQGRRVRKAPARSMKP